MLCEDVTYPGIRGIADLLGLELAGLASDRDGVDPAALSRRIRAGNGAVKALYLNPTIRNPTAETMPMARRA